jgi:hypothetical protein
LGHSSITTTTVYADVTVEETLDAVNGLFEEDDRETDKTDTDHPSDPNTTTKPEKPKHRGHPLKGLSREKTPP